MNTIPTDIKTLVVKIGTSLLTGAQGFDGRTMEAVGQELAELKRTRGLNVLIVSSGAIGCGMDVLGMKERPRLLPIKQAVAAVGQSRLMHYYETLLRTYGHGIKTAQILLSAADLDSRQGYLNVRNTTKALFEMDGVIPVVNENDSVAIEELRFGDNDTLAAKVAAKIDADLLIILCDVDGLYDRNPARHKDAQPIPHVAQVTEEIEALADDTVTETTVGGMKTKLAAAKIACATGLTMVIANGSRPGIVNDVLAGRGPMTVFGRKPGPMPHRKRWIAFGRTTQGTVQVDDGARKALVDGGKSLLAAGITDIQGSFGVGAAVRIVDAARKKIARGLVNYSSEDLLRIKGHRSHEIQSILGRKDFDEVVHRDNLVIL